MRVVQVYDKLSNIRLRFFVGENVPVFARSYDRTEAALFSEAEMLEFCASLPRYKRPRKIIFAEVPRNATGKNEKPKLRTKYHADHLIADQSEN